MYRAANLVVFNELPSIATRNFSNRFVQHGIVGFKSQNTEGVSCDLKLILPFCFLD